MLALKSTVLRLEAHVRCLRESNGCLKEVNRLLRGVIAQSANQRFDAVKQVLELSNKVRDLTESDRTSPELMATIFAEWDSKKQANFFNLLGTLTGEWTGSGRCMQFAYMNDDLNQVGRDFIVELAAYAEAPRLLPTNPQETNGQTSVPDHGEDRNPT